MMCRVRAPPAAAEQDALSAALQQPDFYPGHPDEVTVCETHISRVYLAGDRAYKLKKALQLAFVDYRTLQRRRELCGEEVRLNRRLAPELYLGVRSVTAAGGRFALSAEDDPGAVEYLVEMRRYDERCTLAAKLRSGALTRRELVALAQTIARFHARAPAAPSCDANAGANTCARSPADPPAHNVTRNLRELLEIVDEQPDREVVLALARFASAFLATHEQLLEDRSARGMVREVHGDLRAEHVLLDGGVTIVDCVEFDASLRTLDVADDLAFLVMDLCACGAQELAWELVSAYRDAGGDPGDDALVAFYATHRALVRCKVGLLRAAQQPLGSAAREGHTSAARELLRLAQRLAWRAREPLVLVICGLPASGKSHLSRALCSASGIAHVSSDVTRKQLAGVDASERAPRAAYHPDFSARTYSELGLLAAAHARASRSVLVDATFRHRADRDAFARAFSDAAPLLYVECCAQDATRAERAAKRAHDRTDRASDASLAVVLRESSSWEPLTEVPQDAHLTLSTEGPTDQLLAQITAAVDRWLRCAPARAARA